MIEGYDEDDIWMMVEDEFQTLAQSFTAHLHHAEYKRLMKKAREAPRRELPEPTSPMSTTTKQKLQRQARDKSNREVLDRMILGSQAADMANDVEEDKVDDPWRGTALAGLIATGSQEKTSLKGLDKMPSSTRAAQGFAKAETKARTRKVDAIDLLTRPPEKREAMRNPPKDRGVIHDGQAKVEGNHPTVVPKKRTMESSAVDEDEDDDHRALKGKPGANSLPRNGTTLTANTRLNSSIPTAPRQPMKPHFMQKRRKVQDESKEDRLAEVPMFLF
jgi:hypothetical protein